MEVSQGVVGESSALREIGERLVPHNLPPRTTEKEQARWLETDAGSGKPRATLLAH